MSDVYGLNAEQVKRIKRLLTAFETGQLYRHQQDKSDKSPPLETFFAKTNEQIDGMVTDDTDPDNITYTPGTGEVQMWKYDISDSQIKAGTLTATAINISDTPVGEDVLVQLIREPISGRLFIVLQRTIHKAEMIGHIKQGDTSSQQAWLLQWNGTDSLWERTETKIDVWGDQGFRGVAFGKTESVDHGDKIDVYFSVESARWYGVVGGWYFHGSVAEDIESGDSGNVTVTVGAGTDAREISVEAFSPYTKVFEGENVSVTWNTFSNHWDIGFSRTVTKAEMIGTLKQGDTGSQQAWLMEWNATSSSWVRTDKEIDVYGDSGFKGVAFGSTSSSNNGDITDVYFSSEAGRWYAIVGNWYFHGNCDADIEEGASGNVTLAVGAGTSERDIIVNAFSPYKKVFEDDYVSVTWNTTSNHWDIGKFDPDLWGCGLERHKNVEDEEDPDNGKVKIVPADIAGCGLKPDPDNDEAHTCKIDVDPTAIAGDGLRAVPNSCKLAVAYGCGLYWEDDELKVSTSSLINGSSGLELGSAPEPDPENPDPDPYCAIKIKEGCGIYIDVDGAVSVAHDELAGDGLNVSGLCQLDVLTGCGLWIDTDGAVAVAHDELAGDGLTPSGTCQLDVVCGCGLQISSGAVAVNPADLVSATSGLIVDPLSTCGVKINEGCGIWIDSLGATSVAHDELTGKGLVIGVNACDIDVSLATNGGLEFDSNQSIKVKDGCGIFLDSTGVSVAHDELAGKGLVIGVNACDIDVSLATNGGLSFDSTDAIKIKEGCGIVLDSDGAVAVAHDELAGNGLVIGTSCAIDIDCAWIKANCIDATYIESIIDSTYIEGIIDCAYVQACVNSTYIEATVDCTYIKSCVDSTYIEGIIDCAYIQECITAGCGLFWETGTQTLSVAHDELAGDGLVIGDNCEINIDCDWIKTNCINATYIESVIDSTYIEGIIDSAYIEGIIDCDYVLACLTGGTSTAVQFVSDVSFDSGSCTLSITYGTLNIPSGLGITVT